MQSCLQLQKEGNEINEEEFDKFMKTSKQVHSALYNYAESRLLKLTSNIEFKEIILKHSEFYGTHDMEELEEFHYLTIIKMFI